MNLTIRVSEKDFNSISYGYKKFIELGISKHRNEQMCYEGRSDFNSCKACNKVCYVHGKVSNKFTSITILKGFRLDDITTSMNFEVLGVSIGVYNYLLKLGKRL